jgi:putative ABC transport system permease protein
LELVSGRNFTPDRVLDITGATIVNEAAVAAFEMESPIGKTVGSSTSRTIIGVVKDFNFNSLHSEIEPMVIRMGSENYNYLAIRMDSEDVVGTLNRLKDTWASLRPGEDFAYVFLDDLIDREYRTERRTGLIIMISAALAVFVACMGLFGMAANKVAKRAKEIGIRKVLGASVPEIIRLLVKEYLLLVVIAVAIASPAAYYFMSRWLSNFAYSIDLGWPIILVAALLTTVVALMAVIGQAVRGARANPVESIKYE